MERAATGPEAVFPARFEAHARQNIPPCTQHEERTPCCVCDVQGSHVLHLRARTIRRQVWLRFCTPPMISSWRSRAWRHDQSVQVSHWPTGELVCGCFASHLYCATNGCCRLGQTSVVLRTWGLCTRWRGLNLMRAVVLKGWSGSN